MRRTSPTLKSIIPPIFGRGVFTNVGKSWVIVVLWGGVLEKEPYERTGFSPANTSGWQKFAGKKERKRISIGFDGGEQEFLSTVVHDAQPHSK